jgi:hypothetical protein
LTKPIIGNFAWCKITPLCPFSQAFGVRPFELRFANNVSNRAVGSVSTRVIADKEIRSELGRREFEFPAGAQVPETDGNQHQQRTHNKQPKPA